MNKLDTIFESILDAESKLIPVLIPNPENQLLAGVAYVGEAALFNLISALHAKSATPATSVPAAA